MSNLARLGEEVSRDLEESRIASGGASRVRAKIVTRSGLSPRPKPRLRIGRIAGALALAATIVFGIAFASSLGAKRELTFAVSGSESGVVGAFIAAPATKDVPLSFSDGTRIVLAPSTRARVSSVTPKGARLLVESGKLHADVVHTGDAKWAVEAGPFEVRVTGTSFDVAWDPKEESIVVALSEGSVVVSGCALGEGKRVVRGEELRVSCKQPTAAATAPATVTPAALPDAPEAPEAIDVAPTPSAKTVTAAASASAPAASAAPAVSAKPATATNGEPTAAELLAAADAARYQGDFDRAIESLVTVRRRFAGTDAASSAAFELGRIAFDVKRDFANAGDWFDVYLRERPNGTLAREALGRALEARHRAGDATRAERHAVRYLAAYPDGPHSALAKKLAAPGTTTR